MSSIENGGQAFPVAGSEHGYPEPGMSLRDYFAAKAMQGRAAIPGYVDCDYDVEFAYRMADAMIKERNK